MQKRLNDLIGLLNQGLEGRYHVVRELGQGGMATVYLAEDLKHSRMLALKVLLPELASVVGSERFLREIQIAANLRHPHILPLLDSGDVDGLPFYVMPLVEGESLRERLDREKQLPIDEVLQIGREVADALSYAHERGVVHRDIKPGNIMVDAGHAVVADFGIALATEHVPSHRLTASGVSPGSPQYMSPEQAAGDGDVDARSDIYSLGSVLFESLSGDPPFTGRVPQAILAKKLREAPPSLRVVRDTIPEALENVINTALARSPADRYQTASALGDAFRAVAEGQFVPAPPGAEAAIQPPDALFSLRSVGGILRAIFVAALVFTGVGFLTNLVYDVTLNIPTEYTPSRWDLPIVGLRATIPALVFGMLAVVGFWLLGILWRLLSAGLERTPGLGKTYDSWRNTASGTWERARDSLSPRAMADGFFFLAILAGVLAMSPFWDYLNAIVELDPEVLAYSNRDHHERYNLTLAPLIVALLLGWRGIYRYLSRRGPVVGRLAIVRWGSLGWIGFLLIMAALPWRLAYNSFHERARLDGEMAYILIENDLELVIYQAESRVTSRHQKAEDLPLERFGTRGYLFEGPDFFAGGTDED